MPRHPERTREQFLELVRTGMRPSDAARQVGVPISTAVDWWRASQVQGKGSYLQYCTSTLPIEEVSKLTGVSRRKLQLAIVMIERVLGHQVSRSRPVLIDMEAIAREATRLLELCELRIGKALSKAERKRLSESKRKGAERLWALAEAELERDPEVSFARLCELVPGLGRSANARVCRWRDERGLKRRRTLVENDFWESVWVAKVRPLVAADPTITVTRLLDLVPELRGRVKGTLHAWLYSERHNRWPTKSRRIQERN